MLRRLGTVRKIENRRPAIQRGSLKHIDMGTGRRSVARFEALDLALKLSVAPVEEDVYAEQTETRGKGEDRKCI